MKQCEQGLNIISCALNISFLVLKYTQLAFYNTKMAIHF